jgi:hypothetical protein
MIPILKPAQSADRLLILSDSQLLARHALPWVACSLCLPACHAADYVTDCDRKGGSGWLVVVPGTIVGTSGANRFPHHSRGTMQRQVETTLSILEADPYVRVQFSRYESSFQVTERLTSGESQSVAVKLPRGRQGQDILARACISALYGLRHADCDDKQWAIEILQEVRNDADSALRQLQPQEVKAD